MRVVRSATRKSAHRFVEEAGVVAGVTPHQARVEFAILQRCEGAMQQGSAGTASQKGGIDIKCVEFAIETQAAVTRRTQAGQTNDTFVARFGHQHSAAANGILPAGGMALERHGAQKPVGKNAGIGVLPGFDIDARQISGIRRPRLSETQREIIHDTIVAASAKTRQATKFLLAAHFTILQKGPLDLSLIHLQGMARQHSSRTSALTRARA